MTKTQPSLEKKTQNKNLLNALYQETKWFGTDQTVYENSCPLQSGDQTGFPKQSSITTHFQDRSDQFSAEKQNSSARA